MAMYHQLIIFLSLAAVLHAEDIKWVIKYEPYYQYSSDDLNAETARLCIKNGVSKPPEIDYILPETYSSEFYFVTEVGAPPQTLKSWIDTCSSNTQIRFKTCKLIDLSCNANNVLAFVSNTLSALVSSLIRVSIGGATTLLQVIFNEKNDLPSNVGCLFGLANYEDRQSFLYDLYYRGQISVPMFTFSFKPTTELAGEAIIGSWDVVQYSEVMATVQDVGNWEFIANYMTIGEFIISKDSKFIIDSTSKLISIGDKKAFITLMEKIGAVRGKGLSYFVGCSTVSSLPNIILKTGDDEEVIIESKNYIRKVNNSYMVLITHIPGKNVLGTPLLQNRTVTNNFKLGIISFSNCL